ncbi:MAG: RcnB family protein [Proteobacteria bacterium]|nr:RcnB family protein [Pseudomonadota bacterium]
MKLLLVSAAAATLILASPALAQDDHGHRHEHGGHNGGNAPQTAPATPATHGGHNNGGATTTAAPVVPPHQHISPGNAPNQTATDFRKAVQDAAARNQREHQNDNNAGGRRDNNSRSNDWRGNDHHDNDWRGNDRHDNNRPDNSRYDNDRHDNNWRGDNGRHDGNWNNNGRHDDRGSWQDRFNRRNVTAQHHYRWRGGEWRWPGGYHYRRWTFGMTLPSLFWGSNYWINDYYYYGLGAPPPGTVWVRYGNDAILIDRYSGEILEVVYDQFY